VQAANDGLRGLYMLAFEGPDSGKGFVLLSNGDNPAVLFQCQMSRLLLGPSGAQCFPWSLFCPHVQYLICWVLC
jgi:hypothetical protein